MKNDVSLEVRVPYMDDLRVLSVLPVLGHPRDSKRIAMLQESKFVVEAVAFERDYHSGRLPTCPVESLGRIENRKYIKRIMKLFSALPVLRRKISENDLVYASGPDMAYIALIAGVGLRKPVVLEVGDIREIQVADGLIGWVVRMLDRLFLTRCSLLIATAPGFVQHYYREWLKSAIPAMVIENKLEASVACELAIGARVVGVEGKPLVDRPLRIGYFGALRSEWSWQVLKQVAESRSDIEIVFAGYPMKPADLPSLVSKYKNMRYLGTYQSPGDLPHLYGSIDIVWACYPPIGPQEGWARTNRFYESCLFRRPMICRLGSSDAVEVQKYGIGLIASGDDASHVAIEVSSISLEDVDLWRRNMEAVPKSLFIYTTEPDDLYHKISELLTR